MRITKCLCLVISFLLFSCNKEETSNTDSDVSLGGALLFTAYIRPLPPVMSRVTTNNSWIGVADNGIGVKIGEDVRKYVVDEDGNTTSEVPFYWKDFSSSTVSVSAWYPYNDGVKPEMVVCSDQSVAENYQKSDFLECDTKVSTESTELIFTHAGAKIICNLILDSSIEASLDDARIFLYDMVGVNEGTTIIATAEHQALVVPQVIPANTKFIGVELGDGRYSEYGGLEAELVIEKGYIYPLDIIVSPVGVNIVPQDAIPWKGSSVEVESGSEVVDSDAEGDKWENNGENADIYGESSTVSPGNGSDSAWGDGGTENVEAGTKDNQSDSGTTEEQQ